MGGAFSNRVPMTNLIQEVVSQVYTILRSCIRKSGFEGIRDVAAEEIRDLIGTDFVEYRA